MDKSEIIQILEDETGASIASEVPEAERGKLYERLRIDAIMNTSNALQLSKQLCLISDALEL